MNILIMLLSILLISCCANSTTHDQQTKDSVCPIDQKSMDVSFLSVKLGTSRKKALEILSKQGLYPDERSNICIVLENFAFGSHSFEYANFRMEDEKVYNIYATSVRSYDQKTAYMVYSDFKKKFINKYGDYKTKEEKNDIKQYEELCANTLECIEFNDKLTKITLDFLLFKTDKKPGDLIIDNWDKDNWYTSITIEPHGNNHDFDDIK